MRKLKLDLDALTVSTFSTNDTASVAEIVGTVKGRSDEHSFICLSGPTVGPIPINYTYTCSWDATDCKYNLTQKAGGC